MEKRPKRISVILSTYNMPAWLEKTLWGYAHQTHRNFEIVLADDGSGAETGDLIQRVGQETGLDIKHVWHQDDGFQKCVIMNRAIEAAEGDYLLFSDGDCVPRADFVDWHHRLARPGFFLSGGYYKLPMALSELISKEDIASGDAFSVRWLRHHGLPFSHRLLRLSASGAMAKVLNKLTTTRATWNGHNASGWMDDIVNANGFDERMRYGGEDRELGERLENAGIHALQIRFQAICLHLDHGRGYVTEEDLQRNRQIRDITLKEKRTRTDHGIRQ